MSYKIKSNSSWKTVKLEEGLIARGIPEDMVGIEELSDYKLVKKGKQLGIVKKVAKVNGNSEEKPKQDVKAKNNKSEAVPKSEIISQKKLKAKNVKDKKTASKDSLPVDTLAKPENGKLKKKKKENSSPVESAANPEDKPSDKKKKKKKKKKGSKIVNQETKPSSTEDVIDEDNQSDEEEVEEPVAKKPKKGKVPAITADEGEVDEADHIAEDDGNFEITPDMIIWKAMYLPDPIVRAVWELGFENPTAIQLAVLPTAMKGRRDVVGAAETGSGKTLAFGIPILYGIMKDKEFEKKKSQQLEDDEASDGDEHPKSEEEEQIEEEEEVQESENEESNDIQGIGCVRVVENLDFNFKPIKAPESKTKLRALIITPTRELAVQIEKHLKAVAKYTGVTIALVIGGMAAPKQERLLSKGPDIVIGTPGRLWELIEGGNPHLSQVNKIRYLALDETDRLLEQGHFGELRTLLEHINKDENLKRWRQNFVFSATLTLAHDLPARLGNAKRRKKKEAVKLDKLLSLVGVRPKAKVVDLTSTVKSLKPASLSEMKLFSASIEDKDYYLYYFLKHHPGRTLVFCNSINNVRRLSSVFTLLGMNPLPLHAQMHQKQRLKHLERFTATDDALLFATDVAARGLDIPHVQHVVHFQVPRTSENYVHRSGRTARASRDGLSLMLIEPGETSSYKKLCSTLKKDKTDLPDYDIDMRLLSAVKQRVNLARSIELLEHRTKRERSDVNWVKKMAEEADIVLDDDRDEDDDGGGAAHSHAQLLTDLKTKRNQLSQLLARPLKRSVN